MRGSAGRRCHAEGVPPARRAFHAGRREAEASEQPGRGKPGVDADHGDIAQAGLRPIDDI